MVYLPPFKCLSSISLYLNAYVATGRCCVILVSMLENIVTALLFNIFNVNNDQVTTYKVKKGPSETNHS